jgi:REP element-mobilizing transposase RayT
MVLAYHVIIGAYGFWLPNDPRGSWSQFVGAWELYRAGGKATFNPTTESVAGVAHDWALRQRTKESLKHPAVRFAGTQAKAIGDGFANYVARSGLKVWACAIMPDHLHLVVGRFRTSIEQVVIQLKGAATECLVVSGLHPLGHIKLPNGRHPKCFARGECSPFLDNVDDISRAIAYVEENPKKAKLPRQRWSFVTQFDPSFADAIQSTR